MELAVIGTLTNLSQKVITQTIQTSFGLVKNFVSTHHEQINEVLEETDLLSKLEVIQALIHDIQDHPSTKDIWTCTQKSLIHLSIIVEKISLLLKQIDEKIQRHQQKYFSSWRALNYEKLILELKSNIRLLDMRYLVFLDILKVTSFQQTNFKN